MTKLRNWMIAATTAAVLTVAPATVSTASAAPRATTPPPLTFGIYPGGYAGGGSTDGKPDDSAKIGKALARLQNGRAPFLLRDYIACDSPYPDSTTALLKPGRRLDLVVSYSGENMADWTACLREKVRLYGPVTDTISVTLEQNYLPVPNGNTALVQGVIAAREAADRNGLRRLQIGMDEIEAPFAYTAFWQDLARLGGARFAKAVGFVGVDLYPNAGLPGTDPVPDAAEWIRQTLDVVRNQEMPLAGLGADVPIRVAENGWSTYADPDRTPAAQAHDLTREILAVNSVRGTYNVTSYEMFALRDDLTGSANPFDGFGLMTDDYSPKPMFWIYQGLIAALGKH
jgi:hypothetical protein